jgi:ABC-type Mn2+/Zn2+ transport system ATPase subunit
MYVAEVRLRGVKGFKPGGRDVHLSLARPDGSFAGWTVIAGRNGAGKSAFLVALINSYSMGVRMPGAEWRRRRLWKISM